MRSGCRIFLGGLCLLGGAGLLLHAALVTGLQLAWQARHRADFVSAASRVSPDRSPTSGTRRFPAPKRGDPIARLRVPRLGIDAVVAEGTDRRSLSLGPGHLEGSALPGEADNCVIAGHRDGAFGRLRSVRPGDLVEISGRAGLKLYRVVSIEIAAKSDTAPLATATRPILTLVTCYPFDDLGPAPRRFIVRGALVDQKT